MDEAPSAPKPRKSSSSFRKFFGRGLAILLPTVLTAWLVVIAYQFVNQRIAQPINGLVRFGILELTDFPAPEDTDYDAIFEDLTREEQMPWRRLDASNRLRLGQAYTEDRRLRYRVEWMKSGVDPVTGEMTELTRRATELARRNALLDKWEDTRFAGFVLADLSGLVFAVVLVVLAGLLLSNLLGRKLYAKGEELINRVPLIGRVYPSVKQVTDFFFGEKESQISFNRVVAVQYPRKGLWSVGLVTGSTMRTIQDAAGQECLTVFVPSSPTPFTGYVITVPVDDTIDLGVTIEDALKFAVSGGVLIPPVQQIDPADAPSSADLGIETAGSALPAAAGDGASSPNQQEQP